MIRHSHKLLLAAVLSGFSAFSGASVEAGCHGNSGGGYSASRSYSSSHSHIHSYSQPVYLQPVYRQPVYPQQTYPQPVYPQPVYGQPVYGQAGYAQPGYGQPQLVPGQQQQTFPQSQPLQQPQYQGQAQPLQQPQMQQSVAVNGGAFNGNLANGQQQMQQPQQQVQQQQLQAGTAQASAPQAFAQQNQAPAGLAPTGAAPAVAAPNGNLATNAPPANDATQSALQALGGFAPPQDATVQSTGQVPQAPQSTFTGSWTASLSNGARVQLSLQADGNFSWVAVNKDGQSSSFEGTYSMENGSLSLSRSTDGQKLTGSLTPSGANNFSFKLSDAQASSLDFVRG